MKLLTAFLVISGATAFCPVVVQPASQRSAVVVVEMAKEARPSVVSSVTGLLGTFAVASMLSWNVAAASAATPPNTDVLDLGLLSTMPSMTLSDSVPTLDMGMPSYGQLKTSKYSVETADAATKLADKLAANADRKDMQLKKAGKSSTAATDTKTKVEAATTVTNEADDAARLQLERKLQKALK